MKYKLQDIIDIDQFQSFQDKLNAVYSFTTAILDNEGNILTAKGWQDVCTKFHRPNTESEKACKTSDRYIYNHIHEANPAVSYKCLNGIYDSAFPIIIEGEHYGNFFIGQYFLESPDLDFFRNQAKKYGFNEEEYIEAVKNVPIYTQKQLDNNISFVKELIDILSKTGLKNLKEIESKKQLAESEEQFRDIFEFAPYGMLVLGLDGKFIRVNKALCDMFGYSETELKSLDFKTITHPDDISTSNQMISKLISKEVKVIDFEKRYIHKSGDTVYTHVRSIIKYNSDGSPLHFITHLQDITEQKIANKKLEVSENRFRTITENSPDAIFIVDKDGNYVYANKASANLLGYSNEELLKLNIKDVGEQSATENRFQQLLKDGQVFAKMTLTRKNGSRVFVDLNALVLPNGLVYGSCRDLTERKNAEKIIMDSNQEKSWLLKSMINAFVIFESVFDENNKFISYRFQYINDAYERITGVKNEEVKGKTVHEVWPETEPEWIKRYGEVAISGKSQSFELYHDPTKKFYNCNVYRPFNTKEKFCVIFEDTTESKQAEEKLKESENKYRTLFENLKQGVFFQKINGELVNVNEAALEIFGLTEDQFLGKTSYDPQWEVLDSQLQPIPPEKHPSMVALNSGKPVINLLVAVRNIGLNHFRWVVVNAIPQFKDDERKPYQVFVSLHDITERVQSQEKLKLRERELQRAEKIAGFGNWSLNLNEKVMRSSDGARAIYGLDENENILDEVQRMVLPEYRETLDKALSNLVKNGTPYDVEFKIQRESDGKLVDIHSVAEYSSEAKIVFGVIQDITLSKQAKEELRQSEERYRKLITSLDAGIVIHAPDTSIKFNNQRASELLGLSDDQMRGKKAIDPYWKFIHENNSPLQLEEYPVNRILSTKKPINNLVFGVARPTTKDIAWLTVNGLPVINENGEIEEILISFIDITDRKRAEEILRNSEQELRTILDVTPFPIAIVDLNDDEIKFWTSSALKLFGHTAPTAAEWYQIAYPDPNYRNQVIERWKPALELAKQTKKPVNTGEYNITCHDGSVRICELYAAFLNDKLTVTFNDITEQKKAEKEILKLNNDLELRVAQRTQQLEEANKEMESFVYSISHDLRAPLRSIMGFSEIISKRQKDKLNEEGQEYFGYVIEASKNMANLIEDLLRFSRLKKSPANNELVDLNEILELVKQNLNQDILNYNATIVIPNNLPNIVGEKSLLSQILTNLIHNAMVYHRNGINPEVTITNKEDEKSIALKVSDNGQGIPKEHFSKVFNIFQRLHSSDHSSGTGIGLAIVKKAVATLGGQINLESEVNVGSSFTITLPKGGK